MKILIATGIFPPDIGGPATYLKKLVFELDKKGFQGQIITYTDTDDKRDSQWPIIEISRKYILPFRYFFYSWQLFRLAKKTDIIYAQDLFSSGLPAALVKKILKKKLVIRLGGDFLWEKAINKEWTKKPLKEYYQDPKSFKEKIYLKIGQLVLKSSDLIIFSTNWQKEIYLENYQIDENKVEVVENPFSEIEPEDNSVVNQKIIFAGRLIKLKNIDFLIRAFANILDNQPDLKLEIIGQGPEKKHLNKLIMDLDVENSVILRKKVPHQELIKEINKCFLFIIPSLTEISPNLALECIKIKKPILLTKETGFYERFRNNLIFINPFNQKDLENKINLLLDKKNYQEYQEKISLISIDYSWTEVTDQHINIFKKIV